MLDFYTFVFMPPLKRYLRYHIDSSDHHLFPALINKDHANLSDGYKRRFNLKQNFNKKTSENNQLQTTQLKFNG